MKKGAIFSPKPEEKYRYSLWRIWDETKEVVLFIGLNPSTADCEEEDQTIKKLIKLTTHWGFGGFYIVNLFAFITPHPKDLLKEADPIGTENDSYIQELSKQCNRTILMWGTDGNFKGRDKVVLNMITDPYCISHTKAGHPIHPLYQKSTLPLKRFENNLVEKPNYDKPMKVELTNERQTITVYKINPNKQERNGEVILDRNADGRIFYNTKLKLTDHTMVLENEKDEIEGIFSLHHYYFLKN